MHVETDFSMQSAVIYGITQELPMVYQQTKYRCPSGFCTYPSFTSLAVCNECKDISSRLFQLEVDGAKRLNLSLDSHATFAIRGDPVTQYHLPNGMWLDNTVALTMYGTANQSNSMAFQHIDSLIWSQGIIRHRDADPRLYKTNETSKRVEATECALYYCVMDYNSSVADGVLRPHASIAKDFKRDADSWKLLPSAAGAVEASANSKLKLNMTPSRDASLAFHPRFSYLQRHDLSFTSTDSDSKDKAYNISQAAVNGISSFIQKTFAACITPYSNCSEANTTGTEAAAENWTPLNGFYMLGRDLNGNQDQFKPSIAQAFWRSENLTANFEAIAASMTNAIRAGADNQTAVIGSVGVPVTLYHVDWRWISLHCAIEFIGMVFILLTLIKSAGHWRLGRNKGRVIPMWGTSSLAVLSRGGDASRILRDADSLADMEDRARNVSVALLDTRIVEVEADDLMMNDMSHHVYSHGSGGESLNMKRTYTQVQTF